MKFTLPCFGSEQVEIEECTRFKMFHEEGKLTVLWLQSLDDPAVAFSLGDPALLNLVL